MALSSRGRILAALLILVAAGCGGTSGGGSGLLQGITHFKPEIPVESQAGTVYLILGGGFAPRGAGVIVRFEATEGTPFLGGTSATLEVSGQIEASTQIRGTIASTNIPYTTPGPVLATVTVVLPGGQSYESEEPLATFNPAPPPPPAVSGFAPPLVVSGLPKAFTITGGPFVPVGGTATIEFVADAGSPFSGGVASRLFVSATIDSLTQISGTIPAMSVSFPTTAAVDITLPGGTSTASGPGFAAFSPDQRVVDLLTPDAGEGFGTSVAIDGDTAVVGIPYKGIDAVDDGAVQVYTWDGTAWQPQAEIRAHDHAQGDEFGTSVAISAGTIVVGSPFADLASSNRGAAYVFTGGGATWTLQQKLEASDGALGDHMGLAVAIDGDTIAVGTPDENNAGGTDAGSVYVYERSGGTWSEVAKLLAPGGAGDDLFGTSVSVSSDTIVAGAPEDDDLGSNAGTAHVFVRGMGGAWAWQQQLLRPNNAAAHDHFGHGLAVSGDTVVVGAPTTGSGLVGPSAQVYVRSGATWSHQQVLTDPTVGAGDAFAYAVDIDGDRILVGAPAAGTAYFFDRLGGTWSTPGPLSPAIAAPSFGGAVAVSGPRAVIGAPSDGAGAIYFE